MADVEAEGRAQVDKALAAGIKLSHLDSHMGTLFSSGSCLGSISDSGSTFIFRCCLRKILAQRE